MPNPLDKVLELQIQRTMNALEANNMEAHYVARADQVKDFVAQMIPEGATVANGGSATLAETGVQENDRVTVTPARIKKLESRSFKTESGIEVRIPAELCSSDDAVEFIHSATGGLSLLIKEVLV